MKLQNITKIGIATCGLLMAAVSQVHAASVTLTCDSVSPGLTSGINISIAGQTYNDVYTGRINWTVQSGGGVFADNSIVSSYCIQFLQDVIVGSTGNTYDVTSLSSYPATLPVGGSDASYGAFTQRDAEIVQAGLLAYPDLLNNSSYSSVYDAAAQLTIWKLEYGANITISATSTNADAVAAVALANQTYGALVDPANQAFINSQIGTNVNSLVALTSDSLQDQIMIPPAGSGAPPATPLPAALPAGLALMSGMAGVRKLRRKLV